ncbi:hypothetical protein CWI36_0211p0030 [Hamiltosporidium magnivora]|uniref:C2H2-type domain-containing protein n=1 Tax=Hamiltosporidium magnivora TaxID=148818 RepID=A0A4Q9LIF3_9MICR|nr:hypothetical protein CWI36_0211p0030 [Hamiltosporidium magnivora]
MIFDKYDYNDDLSLFMNFLSKIHSQERNSRSNNHQETKNYVTKKYFNSYSVGNNNTEIQNKMNLERKNNFKVNFVPNISYSNYIPIPYDNDKFLCRYCNIRYVYKRCLIKHMKQKHKKHLPRNHSILF